MEAHQEEMMNKEKMEKAIVNSNTGSTMVETLVSFTVLFIVLGALYSIVNFSSELYFRSVDSSRMQQKFYREIYKTKDQIDSNFLEVKTYSPGTSKTAGTDGEARLSLRLNTELTNVGNAGDEATRNSYINLNDIGVTTYVTKEEESGSLGIMPKTVVFDY